jgi:Fe-S-cluster containining protein
MAFLVPHCGGCHRHCCGEISGVRPILMPWEKASEFFGLVEQRGKLFLLRRRVNGSCVFFHQEKCGIYDRRPFECRVYPFVLDFSKKTVDLRLDTRAACHIFVSPDDRLRLLKAYSAKPVPIDWARAYALFSEYKGKHT